ncbi:Proteasome subunit beta type-4 [Balamuthia mandrillaris]
MDSVIGLVGKDYVLVATDTGSARSILRMKQDEDKIVELDGHKIMGMAGPVGDRSQFGDYVQKNVKLYRLRNGITLGTHATANFVRGELADALRRAPYQVNVLLGGWDEEKGCSLYFIDYLAAMHKVNFSTHGYAGYFVLSILDKHWRKDMELEEGLAVVRRCVEELRTRFIINSPDFVVKVVSKEGTKVVPLYEEDAKEKMKE